MQLPKHPPCKRQMHVWHLLPYKLRNLPHNMQMLRRLLRWQNSTPCKVESDGTLPRPWKILRQTKTIPTQHGISRDGTKLDRISLHRPFAFSTNARTNPRNSQNFEIQQNSRCNTNQHIRLKGTPRVILPTLPRIKKEKQKYLNKSNPTDPPHKY